MTSNWLRLPSADTQHFGKCSPDEQRDIRGFARMSRISLAGRAIYFRPAFRRPFNSLSEASFSVGFWYCFSE